MKIPSKIPGKLSIRGEGALFTSGTAAYNYAFNGIPFLSCASELDYGRRKIIRRTAPFRKDQVDQQVNPGEQSLAGYWLRSQLSFHGGAGLVYSDTGEENPFSDIRFNRSKNVDPWTRGELSLLNRTQTPASPRASVIKLVSFTFDNGTGAVAGIQQNTFFWQDQNFNVANVAFVENLHSITSSGSHLFVATDNGIFRAEILTSTVGAFTKIYNTTPTASIIEFVKSRLMYATNAATNTTLYELSPNPAAPPAALPTALYVSPIPGFSFTSFTESAPAIYAVGSAGSISAIYKITIDSSGAAPVLKLSGEATTLPAGEVAVSAYGYLGTFVAIGTSRGARISRAVENGDLTYGPLIFETNRPVKAFAGFDRFIWAGYSEATETDIRVARIDLSLEIEALRFAWATDLVASVDTNGTDALAFCGNRQQLAFATSANLWMENPALKAATGYLDTARARMSTLEPKVFRSVRVRGPALEGPLSISVINEDSSVTPVFTYGIDSTPGFDDINLPEPNRRNWLALRFTLAANGSGSAGAELHGWQLKILPGSPRQRMITLPLWCYDFEKDRHGQRVGGHRTAMGRLRALEALDDGGDVVTFQDLDADTSRQVFIEELEFEQQDAPPRFEGWGGIIRITFRTI